MHEYFEKEKDVVRIGAVQWATFLVTILLLITFLVACESNRNTLMSPIAMYQGDAQHTGSISTESVVTQPQIKWQFSTNDAISVAPVVFRDTVYVGSDDDFFYAIDCETGTQIWQFQTGGNVRSSACVNEDAIYFTSEDGKLYKVKRDSGEALWAFSTTSRADRYDDGIINIAASPVMDQANVYHGGADGILYAIDQETGKEVWTFKTETAFKSSPALYDGKVYIGSLSGYMYCLDADTGKLKWQYKTKSHFQSDGNVTSSPTIVEGKVFFGGDDFHVYGLDANTGKELWAAYAADQPVFSTLASKDGNLFYGTCGWHNAKVCAVNLKGEKIWEFKAKKKDKQLLDIKGNAAIGSWTTTEDEYFSSPIIAEDTLYISTWNNCLFALDVHTGALRWCFKETGRLAASIAIQDGVIYLGSYDGILYALTD